MTPPYDDPIPQDALAEMLPALAAGTVSPLSGKPCLLFRAGAAGGAEARRLSDALRALPCPTVCIAGRDANRALMRASDVVVRSKDEIRPLAENIAANPIAASVLVQL